MYKLTLNSLFDYTNNDGVFTYLASQNVPWKNDVDADLLDLDYHSKHGTKIVSKTVTSLLDEDGLSSANKTKLARLLYKKNKQRWDELWGSMGLYDDFNPLDNTNWTEEERLEHRGSDSRTHNLGAKQTTFTEGQQIDTFNKGAQSNSMTKGQEQDTFVKGAETRTTNKGQQVNTNAYGQQENVEGQQVNITGNQSNTHEEQTSAFNSSTYQPDKKVIDTLGQRQDTLGQKTNTLGAKSDTLTEGQRQDSETLATFTDTTTYGNRSDSATEGAREDSTTKGQRQDTTSEGAQVNSESGSDSYTDIHTISKSGNIGVTSSGELIRDFRRTVDWKFFEIIYKDIDEMLCLEVYGCDDDSFSDYKIVSPYKLPIASSSVLGGIKVGQNLSIASDGTLNAQAGGGAVESVNGKTGEVTLDASDVGAASASDMTTVQGDIVNIKLDINHLQGSVLDLRDRTSANESDIVNIKLDINQLQGSVLGLHNDLQAVRQVPTGGTEGQVLTKGASGYDWQTPQSGGGGMHSFHVFHAPTNQGGSSSSVPIAFRMDEKTSEFNMLCGYNLGVFTQFIPKNSNFTNINALTYFPNNGRVFWDGKIAFIMPQSNSSLNMNGINDVFLKTENANFENNLLGYSYARNENATSWYPNPTYVRNVKVHRLACAIVQTTNSYTTNPPKLMVQRIGGGGEYIEEDTTMLVFQGANNYIILYKDFGDAGDDTIWNVGLNYASSMTFVANFACY